LTCCSPTKSLPTSLTIVLTVVPRGKILTVVPHFLASSKLSAF